MAVVTFASGTQTAVISTEHFLSSPNVAGVFQCFIDLVNMAAGDVVELRVYKMAKGSGTQRVVFFTSFSGAQGTDALIAMTVEISNALTDTNAVRFSLKQTFGTGRNFDWSVNNLANFTTTPQTANVTQINGVATTAVTTVNANIGTTQPTNFTGTAGSALVKSDMVDVAGAAVSTTSAQIGVNVVQVNAQTATAAAGVTFPASIASPTNITAGTITTVTNLTNAPTAGDFTATMKTSITTAATAATPSVTVNTNNDKTGYALSSTGNNSAADALLDRADAIETGVTPRDVLKIGIAADSGKLSGAGTTTVTIRNADDTLDRITATVDTSGNRTAVTRNFS